MEKHTLWEGVFWTGSGMVQNDEVIVLEGSGEDMVEFSWNLDFEQFLVHDSQVAMSLTTATNDDSQYLTK